MNRLSALGSLRVAAAIMTTVLMIALAACVSPPVQAMSNARQAVEAARQAGAPTYAPSIYAQARHWLNDAEFALQHWDYARARKSAMRATHCARAAILAVRKNQAPSTATSVAPLPATTSSSSSSDRKSHALQAH